MRHSKIKRRLHIFGLLILLPLLAIAYVGGGMFFSVAQADNAIVFIPDGASAGQIASILRDHGLVRSPAHFLLYVKLTGDESALQPGEYIFGGEVSIPGIVLKLKGSERTRKIRIVEGWDVRRIAQYLSEEGIVTATEFVQIAEPHEGYLYPDTYYIRESITAVELTDLFRNTFNEKTEELRALFNASPRDRQDIIIMASLIEKEAAGAEDREIISGILWKRLDAEHPLQVDASLGYVTNKSSAELTTTDLSSDSPYNTYVHLGLPPTPIGNPSIAAIRAALNPETSPYWYYLHGHNGEPHYATTFEEHKENKFLYIE